MSRFLRELLAAEEPLFTQSMRELEFLSGKKNHDNKLAAEIMEKTRSTIHSLGLDPSDTTDRELYHALEHKIAAQNEDLAASLEISHSNSSDEMHKKYTALVKDTKISKRSWVLKKSVAKDLLREMPPRKIMKHLGYRSLESMLKNENFNELYVALRFGEDDEWLRAYNELFAKKVTPSDFEYRNIEVIAMNQEKWAPLSWQLAKRNNHTITHMKELGVIAVIPVQSGRLQENTLKTLLLIFHYINEIQLYSTFFKLKSTAPNFGKIITDTLLYDTKTGANMAGFQVHWRVVQRYFSNPAESPPDIFQPHIQSEDLHWRKAAAVLYEVSPQLRFWEDLEYVGRLGKGNNLVSMNLFDVVFAYSNQETFKMRYTHHMKASLWSELFIRYMGEPALKKQVLEQLDNDMIQPDTIAKEK